MTQEALKLALEALIWTTGSGDFGEGGQAHEGAKKCLFPAITAIKEALAQTQEPIYQYQMANGSWIDETKESHDYNVRHGQATVRVVHTAPPQHTERPVDCERCNRLEEHAYDLVAKLRVANIKLSMQPQRTWVGLTEEDLKLLSAEWRIVYGAWMDDFARDIEARLKELNT